MNDLFGREKFAHLPRAISQEGKRMATYEIGDIAYWSPGPDVAIYYHDDGEKIPDPGIIIGKMDSGADALNVPGSVKATIEIPDEPHVSGRSKGLDSGCAERMGDGGFLGPGGQKI